MLHSQQAWVMYYLMSAVAAQYTLQNYVTLSTQNDMDVLPMQRLQHTVQHFYNLCSDPV